MNSPQRDRAAALNQLLTDICVLPPQQQAAALQERAGEDPHLIEIVQFLLAEPRGLVDDLTAANTAPTEDVGGVPSQRIGRYKLLQKIGEGGFGTVFMAEQVPSSKLNSRAHARFEYKVPCGRQMTTLR